MLEIVHDIAPNASLVFHDCGWNVLEFNRAIDALADAGCRVIVDDIGWTDEPFFEDGVIAAHAAEAVSATGEWSTSPRPETTRAFITRASSVTMTDDGAGTISRRRTPSSSATGSTWTCRPRARLR